MIKTYPSYKDSDIEWIGKIPKHWSINRVSRNTYVKGRIGWKGLKSGEFISNGPFLITGTDFKNGKIDWQNTYHISQERYEEDPFIILREEDVLITKDGTIGKVVYVDSLLGPSTLNSGIFLTRPINAEYKPLFFYWLISSSVFKKFFDYMSSGSTILHLYQNIFEIFKFPIPPILEQKKIIKYLDYKIKKIDELIEKTEQQIELLKEKRTSLINHCATKGLNPNVEMKDSGIEWIGQIPKHWGLIQLKYATSKVGSGITPRGGSNAYSDEGIPFLRSQNIHFDGLVLNDVVFISQEIHEQMSSSEVIPNDVLLNITGASIGRCYYTNPNSIKYNVNQHVCIIRPNKMIQTKFLYYSLRSNLGQVQIYLNNTGSGKEGLNFQNIKSFVLLDVNKNEQNQIIEFLDKQTYKIDTVIEKETKRIELLKEYRKSLISEVVTGKIDVRNEVTV